MLLYWVLSGILGYYRVYFWVSYMIDIRTVEISPELLALVTEVDEFKGCWKVLHTLSPERLSALRKVATIESIGSSTRIEGAQLSDQEVEALLSRVNSDAFYSRDEEEVAGYAEVMEQVFLHYADIPLTENYIKQLHSLLLKYSSKDVRHRGEYKTLSNSVEAFDERGKSIGIVFETASPFDTPLKMQELVEWLQEVTDGAKLHPLLVMGLFIVSFLAIHPFQDGNGRLSRVLTTLLLLKQGYGYVPYASLESIIEENKEAYYLALRRTQKTLKKGAPNWQPWLIFFLIALKRQKDHLEKKLEKEHLLLESLPALSLEILELTKERGRVTISELERLTKANRNTIKTHLRQLVATGKLMKQGKARGTWYVLG